MKALILDGSYQGDDSLVGMRQAIADELAARGCEVNAIVLRELHIRHCIGCFGCWMKLPGTCVIKDAGRDVARAVIQSDLVVLLTPVTFGGYSSELKKAVDRYACSMLLPFLMMRNGETHHPPRYAKCPAMIGVGVLPQADGESERIFTTLVGRNAINLHAPVHASGVVYTAEPLEQVRQQIQALFKTVEVQA